MPGRLLGVARPRKGKFVLHPGRPVIVWQAAPPPARSPDHVHTDQRRQPRLAWDEVVHGRVVVAHELPDADPHSRRARASGATQSGPAVVTPNVGQHLMGPGGTETALHVNQRVIAIWDRAPEQHQPVSGSACGFDVRDLVDDLTEPALAGQVSLEPPPRWTAPAGGAVRTGTGRCATLGRPADVGRWSGPRSSRT
jgi:hypothetical protein